MAKDTRRCFRNVCAGVHSWERDIRRRSLKANWDPAALRETIFVRLAGRAESGRNTRAAVYGTRVAHIASGRHGAGAHRAVGVELRAVGAVGADASGGRRCH